VLGFKTTIDDDAGTVSLSAPAVIESLCDRFLAGDVGSAPRHITSPGVTKLALAVAPPRDDPSYTAFMQMQSDVRTILGVFIWLSQVYDALIQPCNTMCKHMASPSFDMSMVCMRSLMLGARTVTASQPLASCSVALPSTLSCFDNILVRLTRIPSSW